MKPCLIAIGCVFLSIQMDSSANSLQDALSIRRWYTQTESNLLATIQTENFQTKSAIYTIAYLNSTNACDLILDRIDFTDHAITYYMENGHRVSLGKANIMPGWVYPSLVSLEKLRPSLETYIQRLESETNNTLKVDLLSISAYSVHGSNFTERVKLLNHAESNRWTYVLEEVDRKKNRDGTPLKFGNPYYLASRDVKADYEMVQTNLQSMALSACMEQNPTNLLDIVSTYRFIHAPIPEAISTNDFFQATIGEE